MILLFTPFNVAFVVELGQWIWEQLNRKEYNKILQADRRKDQWLFKNMSSTFYFLFFFYIRFSEN